ncbi:MAG: chemotaxis protein [Proteobacteria bacterium]|nr:MAG: chemotaxis protein [Pseudomonadota bacterium]
MKKLSLKLKLYVSVIVLLLTLGISLIVTSQLSIRELGQTIDQQTQKNLKEIVFDQLESMSGQYGEKVAGRLKSAFQIPQVIKSVIEYNLSQDAISRLDRLDLQQTLGEVLEGNDSVSAVYAFFEPNSYDNNDKYFAGGQFEHSSDTGVLGLWYYRDEKGEVKFTRSADSSFMYDDTMDEFGNRTAEWYLCSRDTKAPCLVEPYLYRIDDGYYELISSLVVPLFKNGEFVGVSAVDINLSILKEWMKEMSQSLFDGKSRVSLLSSKGLIVASSHYNDKPRQALKEVLPQKAEKLIHLHETGSHLDDGDTLYVSYRINVAASNTSWSLLIELPSEVAMARAEAISKTINENIAKSAYNQFLVGGLILLIAVGIITMLVRSVIRPIDEINRRVRNLSSANGDLTQELYIDSHAELIELSNGFNAFLKRLRKMVQGLKEVNDRVSTESGNVSQISKETEEQTSRQHKKIETVLVAMNEMSASVSEVARVANETSDKADRANNNVSDTQVVLKSAVEGVGALAEDMGKASEAITQVAQHSEEINSILEVIRGVAEQTNLLALNAAIEAARAGEQGRGFAVVADEVRTLASKTRESADEITNMIDTLKAGVGNAVDIIQSGADRATLAVGGTTQANQSLSVVVEHIVNIVASIDQVATAVNKQNTVGEGINRNLTEIGEAAYGLQELANKVRGSGEALGEEVNILDKELHQLKT